MYSYVPVLGRINIYVVENYIILPLAPATLLTLYNSTADNINPFILSITISKGTVNGDAVNSAINSKGVNINLILG